MKTDTRTILVTDEDRDWLNQIDMLAGTLDRLLQAAGSGKPEFVTYGDRPGFDPERTAMIAIARRFSDLAGALEDPIPSQPVEIGEDALEIITDISSQLQALNEAIDSCDKSAAPFVRIITEDFEKFRKAIEARFEGVSDEG